MIIYLNFIQTRQFHSDAASCGGNAIEKVIYFFVAVEPCDDVAALVAAHLVEVCASLTLNIGEPFHVHVVDEHGAVLVLVSVVLLRLRAHHVEAARAGKHGVSRRRSRTMINTANTANAGSLTGGATSNSNTGRRRRSARAAGVQNATRGEAIVYIRVIFFIH